MTTAADRLRALTTTTPLEVLGPIVFNQPTRCDLVVYRGDTGRFRVTVTDVAGDRSISPGRCGTATSGGPSTPPPRWRRSRWPQWRAIPRKSTSSSTRPPPRR